MKAIFFITISLGRRLWQHGKHRLSRAWRGCKCCEAAWTRPQTVKVRHQTGDDHHHRRESSRQLQGPHKHVDFPPRHALDPPRIISQDTGGTRCQVYVLNLWRVSMASVRRGNESTHPTDQATQAPGALATLKVYGASAEPRRPIGLDRSTRTKMAYRLMKAVVPKRFHTQTGRIYLRLVHCHQASLIEKA